MKKLHVITTKIFIFLIPLFLLIFAPVAHAQTKDWQGQCVGSVMDVGKDSNTTANSNANPGSADATDVATIHGIGCLLGNVLSVAIMGLGLIGFVMFIVGSFSYMLSGGNAKGTETAKNTITYAIIGIVVALSAFIILNLIANFTGVSAILNFKIPEVSDTPVP